MKTICSDGCSQRASSVATCPVCGSTPLQRLVPEYAGKRSRDTDASEVEWMFFSAWNSLGRTDDWERVKHSVFELFEYAHLTFDTEAAELKDGHEPSSRQFIGVEGEKAWKSYQRSIRRRLFSIQKLPPEVLQTAADEWQHEASSIRDLLDNLASQNKDRLP